MARPALGVGEHSNPTWEVRLPEETRWMALSKLPRGFKPPRGSTWRARASYRSTARTHRLTAEGRTKAIAQQNLLARIEDYRQADSRSNTADTLGTRIVARVSAIEAGLVPTIQTEKSKLTYVSIARSWCLTSSPHGSLVADIPVADLAPGDLAREAQRIAANGGTSQLKHIRALWRASLQEAVNDGIIALNPAHAMGPLPTRRRDAAPRVYSNGAPRTTNDTLSEQQLATLLAVAHADDTPSGRLLADTLTLSLCLGLRIGELNGLRWEGIDLDSAQPTLTVLGKLVRKAGHGLIWESWTKDTFNRRTIPLPPEAVQLLARRRRLLAERGEAATEADRLYVFPSTTHTTPDPDGLNKRMRKVFDRAGLRTATNHTIRRTVEARLRERGVSDQDIEKVLGHTAAVAHRHYWDRRSVPHSAVDALGGLDLPGGGD